MASDDELFDDVLNLEERYHREGYELGYRDGAEAGRVEGRSVGLKQGYEKFLEAGRLQGRAIVWANRIPALRRSTPSQSQPQTGEPVWKLSTSSSHDQPADAGTAAGPEAGARARDRRGGARLPDLSASSARLEKNVATLYGMLEPGTLSTRNDDEAVNDFDSRLKGAGGKSKVIERVVGERAPATAAAAERDDVSGSPAGARARVAGAAGTRNENIEDVGRIR